MKKLETNFLNRLMFIFLSLSLLGATDLIDPTRPPSYQEPEAYYDHSSLHLAAIFIYPTHRIAIINGVPLKSGEKVNEYTVTSINANAVQLINSQHKQEVLQLSTPVKRPSRQ